MKILKTQTAILQKIHNTLRKMENYKSQMRRYLNAISGNESPERGVGRLPQFLAAHFTNRQAATSIIQSDTVEINHKGYIALSALSPIEYRTITEKRDYGFAFFVDDLIDSELDLFTPIATSRSDGIAKQLTSSSGPLAEQLLCETSPLQPAIRFMNQLEIRCPASIQLALCSLFFRKNELAETEAERLNQLGIFQLPYSIQWWRDHFPNSQKWHYLETDEHLEFFDNRVKGKQSIGKVLHTNQLIEEITKFLPVAN